MSVEILVLCEDKAHESFVRGFLNAFGKDIRNIQVTLAPPGSGSGEQFVSNQFPLLVEKLEARIKRGVRSVRLIAVIDCDAKSREERAKSMEQVANANAAVQCIYPKESIEYWAAWHDNGAHTKLKNKHDAKRKYPPKTLRAFGKWLGNTCRSGTPLTAPPPELKNACDTFSREFLTSP